MKEVDSQLFLRSKNSTPKFKFSLYLQKILQIDPNDQSKQESFQMQEESRLTLPRRIKGKHLNTFKDYKIESNYYKVHVAQSIDQIYIFKVVFQPKLPLDNIKQRHALLERALPQIKQVISSPVISGANLYSLKPPKEIQREFKVGEYSILIKQVRIITVKENCKNLLMFLNNGLRNLFRKIGYMEIGKTGKFFQVKNPKRIQNDLNMFSGFKANFMWLEKGIFLRVDSAKKIVRNETVLDYINGIYQSNKQKSRDQKRTLLKNGLIGQIVMTNYGNSRYAKVSDVIFQSVDEIKLSDSGMTLRDFYQNKYQRRIQNTKQPLLEVQSRSKKEGDRTILVPELCLMTGIPDSFDEFKRKKISQETILSPADKKREIENFVKEASKVDDLSSLKELGINIDSKLNQVTAKLIPCPRLQLGSNRSVESGKESMFNLFKDAIFESKHQIKCGIFTTENADVRAAIDTFKNTSRGLGVSFQCETYTCKEREKNRILNSYFREIEYAISKQRINIVLIVIPNNMKQQYGEIKKECLKKLSIVSQCIVESTLRKKNLQSVATKVLLQMIAKRGNILWVPKITGKISDTMIMAFDSAKGRGGNSIVCCATVNETFSLYYSKTSKYDSNQDKFQEMVKLSFEGIDYYSKRNSRCPKEIIIFHNSCSGDQVSLFIKFFLEALQSKLSESFLNIAIPRISLVMVNVKNSQRFFISDKNVQAGTIVADEIVSENYDFYLVSQGSNRGSSVPNHYKVVYTNSEIEEGILHELIFSQCFNYVNWTGSIKIPGILQYAKKCAKFSAEALDGEKVNDDLNSKLYYV